MRKVPVSFTVDYELVALIDDERKKNPKWNVSALVNEFLKEALNSGKLKDTDTGELIQCLKCGAMYAENLTSCPECIKAKITAMQQAKVEQELKAKEQETIEKTNAEQVEYIGLRARLKGDILVYSKLLELHGHLDEVERTNPANYVDIVDEYAKKRIRVGIINIVDYFKLRERFGES